MQCYLQRHQPRALEESRSDWAWANSEKLQVPRFFIYLSCMWFLHPGHATKLTQPGLSVFFANGYIRVFPKKHPRNKKISKRFSLIFYLSSCIHSHSLPLRSPTLGLKNLTPVRWVLTKLALVLALLHPTLLLCLLLSPPLNSPSNCLTTIQTFNTINRLSGTPTLVHLTEMITSIAPLR